MCKSLIFVHPQFVRAKSLMTFRSLIENVVEILICYQDLCLYISVLAAGSPVEVRSLACLVGSHILVDVPFFLPLCFWKWLRVCRPILYVLGIVLQKSRIVAVSSRSVKEAKSLTFHPWNPVMNTSLESERKQLLK